MTDNPHDWNGYVPDPDESESRADESARDPRETLARPSRLTNPYTDPELRLAWLEGAVNACAWLAAENLAHMNKILGRRTEAGPAATNVSHGEGM